MPYFQRMQLMGVTGSAAEVKYDDHGRPRAHFSLFVTEAWRDKLTGNRNKTTTIFRCVIFDDQAHHAQKMLKRGTWIFAEGRIRTRKIEDKELWNVTVHDFRLLERFDHDDAEERNA